MLGGICTAGVSSAVAGAGTAARFSDTESSTGNEIRAGTLTLQFDGSSTVGLASTLSPGTSIRGSVTLVNDGVAGSLDVDFAYTENDASENATDVTADAIAKQLAVDTLSYGGADVQTDADTLYDLSTADVSKKESTTNDLVDLSDPGTGTEFAVGLTYVDPNGVSYADDGIDVTIAFTLNQDDSQ